MLLKRWRMMEYLKTFSFAYIDELSGLYNRRSFMENYKKTISTRVFRDISIIFLDIDHFKSINDIYGHQAGDKVIKEVSILIKQTIRIYDIS